MGLLAPPVRLALVVDGRGFGGAQVYARSLLRHLPPDVQRVVITTEEHAKPLEQALRPADEMHVTASTLRAEWAPELRRRLEALAPDAVHVNLVDPAGLVAALEAAAATAPALATLHLTGDVGAGAFRDRLVTAYAALRHVAAASVPIADFLVRSLALPAERVTAVRNGVDPLRLPPRPVNDVPVVGVLARLTAQKGLDILLEAAALMVRRGVRFHVVIGGSGRDEAALRKQARGLPVTFAGFQPDPAAFLAGLDLFCHPSRVDALPLSLLEAMSGGLPCVSSDVGDVRSAVGAAAVVVPTEDPVAVADALARLLADPAERARLGRAAAVRARSMTAEAMVERTWAAFSAALTAAP